MKCLGLLNSLVLLTLSCNASPDSISWRTGSFTTIRQIAEDQLVMTFFNTER